MPDNSDLEHGRTKPVKHIPNEFGAWPARGFSAKTIAKYQVNVGGDDANYVAVYPAFDPKTGDHIANKIRLLNDKGEKDFRIQGDWTGAGLFGQQAFPAGSAKQITVTEGQDDAMAVFEMQGYPSVSISGSSSAVRDMQKAFEYLSSFEQVVLCFDNDEAGKKAIESVSHLPFKPGKLRVMRMQEYKDANEYLLNRKVKEFSKEWWAAAPFVPMGLRYGTQMWDLVKEPKKYDTVLYPWAAVNHTTYGIRLSELVLVTAPPKVGKSTILRELASYILKNSKPEYGVGGLFLEEDNADTALALMSIEANKPLHLPDVREGIPEEDMRKWFDASVNTDRLILWDHFGSNSVDGVLDKIRHMAALGCKYIFLDHLSIIVSDQSGDERKQLDEISTKLKMLCMELQIAVIAVIHKSRSGVIRGSAGPEQLANIVLDLERDRLDPDPWRRNVTKITVIYNRFCGRYGVSGVWFDETTNRLSELTPEEFAVYEGEKPEAKDGNKEEWKKK